MQGIILLWIGMEEVDGIGSNEDIQGIIRQVVNLKGVQQQQVLCMQGNLWDVFQLIPSQQYPAFCFVDIISTIYNKLPVVIYAGDSYPNNYL